MEGVPMTIPLWLVELMAGGILTQFIAVVAWMLKSDKDRAVESTKMQSKIDALTAEVSKLAALLDKHNPVRTAADFEAIVQRVEKLEDSHRAHHRLLRGLQTRMDRARLPEEHTSPGDDADG